MRGPLRLQDILNRPVFRDAQVSAGQNGLDRIISWVHILEQTDVTALMHGDELVLTTGIGFHRQQHGFKNFVNQLIFAKAAGLCIELGTVIPEIPQEILDMANEHNFPIIVFRTQVRFIDITQDVHSLILSRHHKLLDDLEVVSLKLQNFTVNALGNKHILEFIHTVTGCPVVYSKSDQKPAFYGANTIHPNVVTEWAALEFHNLDMIGEPRIFDIPEELANLSMLGNAVIVQSAVVLGMSRGTIAFICDRGRIDEYLVLVLDRTANALSLDEFRRLSVQERKMFSEQDFVERVIREQDNMDGKQWSKRGNIANKHYRVVILGQQNASSLTLDSPAESTDVDDEEWVARKTDLAMMVRLALAKQGFHAYLSVRKDLIIAIIEYQKNGISLRERLTAAIAQFQSALSTSGLSNGMSAGVGREVDVAELPRSYRDAITAWMIRGNTHESDVLLYEDAGIYKWLFLLENNPDALSIAKDDLYQILAHDETYQTNLFETLKIYLDCNCSKQQTADRLFIHRQTLYYRLQQIKSCLQFDLDDPVSRLSLHLAIYFHLLRRNK